MGRVRHPLLLAGDWHMAKVLLNKDIESIVCRNCKPAAATGPRRELGLADSEGAGMTVEEERSAVLKKSAGTNVWRGGIRWI